jgi:alpha-1,3-glucosyltransferase
MRATVIVSEYLVYIPAVVAFLRRYGRAQGVGGTSQSVAMVAFLMQPSTILIDHGHFQYNTVMLGLVVAALSSIYAGRLMWSCIFFVAALGYKQMALYYSPIFFAYLLGLCITPQIHPGRLLGIATITVLSLAAVFAPLIIGSLYDASRGITPQSRATTEYSPPPLFAVLPFTPNPSSTYFAPLLQLSQSLHRIFPFARGLFEDKVANFWCALNTVFKIRNLSTLVPLPRLALYITLASILPATLLICAIPRRNLLPYALASSAWSFYLFSFQVHEKSILLPLLPMTLLLGGKDGLSKETRAWVGWANMVGTWTLYPLLKRDGLRTPYFVLNLLWAYLLGLPPTSGSIYYDHANQNEPGKERPPDDLWTGTKILHVEYYVAMMLWHGLEAFIPPPEGKPDLWAVVNVCLGAVAFGICYLWCTWKLVLGTGLLDGYFGDRRRAMERDRETEMQKGMVGVGKSEKKDQ